MCRWHFCILFFSRSNQQLILIQNLWEAKNICENHQLCSRLIHQVTHCIFHNSHRSSISNCFTFNKNDIPIFFFFLFLLNTNDNERVKLNYKRFVYNVFCISKWKIKKRKKKRKNKCRWYYSVRRKRQCSRIPLVKRSLNVIESRKEERNVVTFLYSHA